MNRIKGPLVAHLSLMSPGHTTIIPYPGPLATELSDLLRAIDSFEAERTVQFTELTCAAALDIAQRKSPASEELGDGREGGRAYVGWNPYV